MGLYAPYGPAKFAWELTDLLKPAEKEEQEKEVVVLKDNAFMYTLRLSLCI